MYLEYRVEWEMMEGVRMRRPGGTQLGPMDQEKHVVLTMEENWSKEYSWDDGSKHSCERK